MTQRIREAMKNRAPDALAEPSWPTRHSSAATRRGRTTRPATAGRASTSSPCGWSRSCTAEPKTAKTPVLSLVNATTGEVRSRVIADVSGPTLRKAIAEQVDMANSHLDTDEWSGYNQVGREFTSHATINHSENQYLDPHTGATTNEVEGYFSQLKRSLDGTHHHVSHEHLPRILGRVRLPVLHPQDRRHRAYGSAHGPDGRAQDQLQASERPVTGRLQFKEPT